MNKNRMPGSWQEQKHQAKARWDALTNDDLMRVDGRRDVLASMIQERTGTTRERVDKEIAEFEISCEWTPPTGVPE